MLHYTGSSADLLSIKSKVAMCAAMPPPLPRRNGPPKMVPAAGTGTQNAPRAGPNRSVPQPPPPVPDGIYELERDDDLYESPDAQLSSAAAPPPVTPAAGSRPNPGATATSRPAQAHPSPAAQPPRPLRAAGEHPQPVPPPTGNATLQKPPQNTPPSAGARRCPPAPAVAAAVPDDRDIYDEANVGVAEEVNCELYELPEIPKPVPSRVPPSVPTPPDDDEFYETPDAHLSSPPSVPPPVTSSSGSRPNLTVNTLRTAPVPHTSAAQTLPAVAARKHPPPAAAAATDDIYDEANDGACTEETYEVPEEIQKEVRHETPVLPRAPAPPPPATDDELYSTAEELPPAPAIVQHPTSSKVCPTPTNVRPAMMPPKATAQLPPTRRAPEPQTVEPSSTSGLLTGRTKADHKQAKPVPENTDVTPKSKQFPQPAAGPRKPPQPPVQQQGHGQIPKPVPSRVPPSVPTPPDDEEFYETPDVKTLPPVAAREHPSAAAAAAATDDIYNEANDGACTEETYEVPEEIQKEGRHETPVLPRAPVPAPPDSDDELYAIAEELPPAPPIVQPQTSAKVCPTPTNVRPAMMPPKTTAEQLPPPRRAPEPPPVSPVLKVEPSSTSCQLTVPKQAKPVPGYTDVIPKSKNNEADKKHEESKSEGTTHRTGDDEELYEVTDMDLPPPPLPPPLTIVATHQPNSPPTSVGLFPPPPTSGMLIGRSEAEPQQAKRVPGYTDVMPKPKNNDTDRKHEQSKSDGTTDQTCDDEELYEVTDMDLPPPPLPPPLTTVATHQPNSPPTIVIPNKQAGPPPKPASIPHVVIGSEVNGTDKAPVITSPSGKLAKIPGLVPTGGLVLNKNELDGVINKLRSTEVSRGVTGKDKECSSDQQPTSVTPKGPRPHDAVPDSPRCPDCPANLNPPVPAVRHKPTETIAPAKEVDTLDHYPWYFGSLHRKLADSKVTEVGQEGAFLVRKSERGGDEYPYTLCVLHCGSPVNIKLRKRKDGKFAIGEEKPKEHMHSTVDDLIRFHQNNEIELTKSGPSSPVFLLVSPPK